MSMMSNLPQTIFYCTATVCLFFMAAVGIGLMAQIRHELTMLREAHDKAADSHFKFVELIAMQSAK